MKELPLDSTLPEILRALTRHPNLLLRAEPGAGKTTRLPLALLTAPFLAGKRILLLEPRRIAARAAAEQMARTLSERTGETVGYRMRGDTRVSARTRIEVITEALLTRMLLEDPELPGIGAVLFDEFHERSIHSDLGLALSLQVQESLRPDLRIVVMSATLEADRLLPFLGDVRLCSVESRSHPVDTFYSPGETRDPREGREGLEHVAAVTREAFSKHDGDVLVFLPGRREIAEVETLLATRLPPGRALILPLYSDSSWERQGRALAPAPAGMRKVILSTSIAETSLTIDGVRVVVDSGRMRLARFDLRRGMNRLETVMVSQASADQRRGRAGRQAQGTCYRLWRESQWLMPFREPEILTTDLLPLSLMLTAWGVPDTSSLALLDHPPKEALDHSREILRALGALTREGKLSARGQELISLGLHPRLGAMLLRAREVNSLELATALAAFLEESDRGTRGIDDVDLEAQLESALRNSPRLREQRNRLLRTFEGRDLGGDKDPVTVGVLTAFAYPERIAKRRPDAERRFLLMNGVGAELPRHSRLGAEEFLAIADLDGSGAHPRIRLAAPLTREEVRRFFSAALETRRDVRWDREGERFIAREVDMLGAIELAVKPALVSPEERERALLVSVEEHGIGILRWTNRAISLRQRSEWLRKHRLVPHGWPNLSDEWLRGRLPECLAPMLPGARTPADIDLLTALESLFTGEQRRILDTLAPAEITLPSGRRASVDYSRPNGPLVSVPLQELYGLQETTRIGGGAVPLAFELLSPARHPLQITDDLMSFWHRAYRDVRKEMLGRYPKHFWPEDPLQAKPQPKSFKGRSHSEEGDRKSVGRNTWGKASPRQRSRSTKSRS